MRRFILRLAKLPIGVRLFIGSSGSAILFYFAALLSYLVSERAKFDRAYTLGLHAAIFIVLLTTVFFVARYASTLHEGLRRERGERQAAVLHAYTFIDRMETKHFDDIRNPSALEIHFIEAFVTSVQRLQRTVDATYLTFEATFGKYIGEERVDFEVTFMTESYIDGKITIPAYANHEGRAPRSMVLRKTKPDIYESTVTAAVYRESRPSVHIIEDTSSGKVEYNELYPGEKQDSKSSIIYPVLSDKNELLGTLVVYCDRPCFFKREHQKYWTDMLEIFAKRLAFSKAKMDMLMKLRSEGIQQIAGHIPDFPF